VAIPPVGSRVEITGTMPNDPDPLPIGTQGTVTGGYESARQIFVDWDNGRSLILLTSDPYRVISGPTEASPAAATAVPEPRTSEEV
jgi:hypothetical protein